MRSPRFQLSVRLMMFVVAAVALTMALEFQFMSVAKREVNIGDEQAFWGEVVTVWVVYNILFGIFLWAVILVVAATARSIRRRT